MSLYLGITSMATITPEAALLKLRDDGHDPQRYSGRGMYGKDCVGVVVDSRAEALSLADVLDLKPTLDSMGRGIVAYWPALPWPEDA